jgi:G3E family GTPase
MTEPIPISIITGFLGAGKTTLLNGLLKDSLLANAAVIVNEFGEIGIDHLLVASAGEGVVELSSGCLCCTLRSELGDTIRDLFERREAGKLKNFDRIVIETTGLADPAPVLHGLMSDPDLLARCRLEGVITTVDAVNGMATLDAHAEAVKQVAVADRIVLTKVDLLQGTLGEDMLFVIIGRLRKLAPGARLLTTHRNEATAARLFNTGLYDPATKSVDVRGWLNDEAYHRTHVHDHGHAYHDDGIHAFSFIEDNAVSPLGLEMFLDLVRSFHGPNMLRMKGIVKVSDAPERPVVLHGVQHVFHPPVRLPAWPDGDHRSRLVFIVKDTEPRLIEDLFRAFADQVSAAAKIDKTLSFNS